MTEPQTDQKPAEQVQESNGDVKTRADKLVAEGKKAIALKDWEEGVEKYGEALDLMREIVGEFDPAMAPLLLSYGKALYELAFATQGVMGKEEVNKVATRPEEAVPGGSNFVFGDDGPEGEDEGEEVGEGGGEGNAEAGPSNAGQASKAGEDGQNGAADAEEAEGEGEGEAEGDEPEDDYNAAWEVLDVARTIYSKIVEEAAEPTKEDRLNLAECYLALGDVSLETENFPQAASDYTEALKIKSTLLTPSSRALASVHYQLATVLEFTPNGRSSALTHVQTALDGFKARLKELNGDGEMNEELVKMSEKERENEKKDVEGLISDLELKIEELKTAPEAADPVSESIKHLLGQGGESAFGPSLMSSSSASGSGSGSNPFGGADSAPVNDLTSMVRKKKKPVATVPVPSNGEGKGKEVENGEKRKVGEDAEESDAKKPKTE